MDPKWAIDIQKQCDEQNVAFFFKQWGTWGEDGIKRNKKNNGRILLGQEWNQQPEYGEFDYKNRQEKITQLNDSSLYYYKSPKNTHSSLLQPINSSDLFNQNVYI